jgi:hypothetical protein
MPRKKSNFQQIGAAENPDLSNPKTSPMALPPFQQPLSFSSVFSANSPLPVLGVFQGQPSPGPSLISRMTASVQSDESSRSSSSSGLSELGDQLQIPHPKLSRSSSRDRPGSSSDGLLSYTHSSKKPSAGLNGSLTNPPTPGSLIANCPRTRSALPCLSDMSNISIFSNIFDFHLPYFPVGPPETKFDLSPLSTVEEEVKFELIPPQEEHYIIKYPVLKEWVFGSCFKPPPEGPFWANRSKKIEKQFKLAIKRGNKKKSNMDYRVSRIAGELHSINLVHECKKQISWLFKLDPMLFEYLASHEHQETCVSEYEMGEENWEVSPNWEIQGSKSKSPIPQEGLSSPEENPSSPDGESANGDEPSPDDDNLWLRELRFNVSLGYSEITEQPEAVKTNPPGSEIADMKGKGRAKRVFERTGKV